MKNLRNSIIKMSMESISEIIDHQTLASQLVDDTSDLMASAAGGGASALVMEQQTPSSSPVTTLSAHDVVVDEHDVVVSTGDGTLSDVDGGGNGAVVMVRTIIDGLSHSPVQSTYQTAIATTQQQHGHQQLVATQQQLLQIASRQREHHQHQQQNQQRHHQHQHQHHQQQQRLSAGSPVDFVGSDVTLDALSVSSAEAAAAHIIAVKQEHKLIVLDHNGGTHNNSSGLCGEDTQTHHGLDVAGVSVGVIDELSSDAVEVTLNQHHHQQQQAQQQQQQQLLLQQHYGGGGSGSHAHHHSQQHHLHSAQHQHHQPQQHHHQPQQHSAAMQHQQQRSHSQTHAHETLSVIVQPHEDSRDSTTQMLSPELGVVGVGDNTLEPTTYQTLTSVNERMSPPGFSPNSSYATLTPLQPLPPISTMSDKFAYGGHISGGGVGGNGAGSSSNSSSGGVGGPFAVLPHQSGLGGISLSSLSGVQSPYSSYDKLPSMGMSMSPPPHHYDSSPSHTLSGMVVACELHTASPGGCDALSPQSAYSHTTAELHSPPPLSSGCKRTLGGGGGVKGAHQSASKQLVCLASPVTLGKGDSIVGGGGADYESSYSAHQRDLIITTTPSSSSTSGRHSTQLSPHSVSAGSASLNSPGSCSLVNQSGVVTLPLINGTMATLSAASSDGGLVEVSPLQRGAVVVSLTPTPPPPLNDDDVGTATTLLAIQPHHQHQHQHQQHQQQQQEQLQHTAYATVHQQQQQQQQPRSFGKHAHPVTSDCSLNLQMNSNGLRLTHVVNNLNMCNIGQQQQQQQQQQLQQHEQSRQLQLSMAAASSSAGSSSSSNSHSSGGNDGSGGGGGGGGSLSGGSDIEEINTKELAQRISAELKRYSIPQAIFAQRVLCRSQGTLSDLLRNPKPWSKLKSGRETFRRMFKWLQEPEFQRMSALRMAAAQIPQRGGGGGPSSALGGASDAAGAGGGSNGGISSGVCTTASNNAVHLSSAGVGSSGTGGGSSSGAGGGSVAGGVTVCRRKDEPHIEHMPQPKKPRLVFTDLQRRTLQAIFKETKRPSKEMQVTIARQLGLEPTTVGNFFMNARRRSMDKWRDDDAKSMNSGHGGGGNGGAGAGSHLNNNNNNHHHHNNNHNHHDHHHHSHQQQPQHQSVLSPSDASALDLDDDPEMDLDLGQDDFDLDGDHDTEQGNDDIL